MAKKKINHDSKDFVTALGIDKNDIIDAVETGFKMHMTEEKPLSECILEVAKKLKKGRKPTDNDLKMFSAGMVLSTALSSVRGEPLGALLKSMKKRQDNDLAFTTDDLLKSIRDEMDGQKS